MYAANADINIKFRYLSGSGTGQNMDLNQRSIKNRLAANTGKKSLFLIAKKSKIDEDNPIRPNFRRILAKFSDSRVILHGFGQLNHALHHVSKWRLNKDGS